MIQNVRTPATAMARALENVAVGTADEFQIAPRTLDFQKHHLRHRYGLSAATAAVVAEMAFPRIDWWRAAR
jgi:hypothetical protein